MKWRYDPDNDLINAAVCIITAAIAMLMMFVLTGCRTVQPTPEQRLANVVEVVTMAANTGTRVALFEHPEDKPRFEMAIWGLNHLLKTKQYDVQDLKGVLSQLPINELRSEKGTIIIDSAIVLFNTYTRDQVALKKVDYMEPIIKGIRDGIQRGIQQARVPSQPPMPPGMTNDAS